MPGLFELLQCGQDVCRLGSDGRERRIVPAWPAAEEAKGSCEATPLTGAPAHRMTDPSRKDPQLTNAAVRT
jgi:hypothetical protein